METSERIIKITGSQNISEDLEMDTEYDLSLRAECKSYKPSSNDNGTVNITYYLSLTGDKFEISDGKKVIKAKDKRKRSQKMRNCFYMIWQEKGSIGEFEDYYDQIMAKAIANLEDIILFLKDK